MTMATIAVTLERAADGQVQAIPSVELAQKLRLARTLANVVVVSIHWGNELQDWPSAAQRSAAEWLVDHGADLVVGHHPHVVQRPDCVHGRPVFFSLGNHVFDQKYPETKEGLIADCTIRNRRMRCGGIRTHARRGSAVPVVTNLMDDTTLAACTVDVAPTLTFAGFELRPTPWTASDSSTGVVLEGWKNGALRWQTRRVSLVSLQPDLRDRWARQVVVRARAASIDDGWRDRAAASRVRRERSRARRQVARHRARVAVGRRRRRARRRDLRAASW